MTLMEAGEHVAKTGLPARRQFIVVAEDRARAGGLTSLAKSVTRQLAAPRDLRASVVSWINFVFLPEAVNRCAALPHLWATDPPLLFISQTLMSLSLHIREHIGQGIART